MASGYVFLSHTTDAYIEATGRTFEETLEHAAMALFDTLCEVTSISKQFTEDLEVKGRDEVDLLYAWLDALLHKFELEGKVYSKFKVDSITASDSGPVATAKISGEPYNKRKHGAKVEVKAVTYHQMCVAHGPSSTTVRFILDL